jgi:hypothetical protein
VSTVELFAREGTDGFPETLSFIPGAPIRKLDARSGGGRGQNGAENGESRRLRGLTGCGCRFTRFF